MAFSKRTEGIEKNPNFIPHSKTVRELISVTFWVLTVNILLPRTLLNSLLKEEYKLQILMPLSSKKIKFKLIINGIKKLERLSEFYKDL